MATTITANGINFPDGSASAPSIGGTDTNTGLFTGSDIVGFATGGTERLRITSDGKVGIGTTSPAKVLEIKSGMNSDGLSILKGSNSSVFLGHNGSGDEGLLQLKDGGTTTIQIYGETGQTSYFNAGNVGIGTTSPSSIFHVRPLDETNFLVRNEGSTVVLASETNSGRDNNRGMALEATAFEFIEGGSEKMRIDGNGDICIGRNSQLSDAKVSIQCDTAEAGIAVQLNASSGTSNLIQAYSSAGPNVASICVNPDASPDLLFKVHDGSNTVERLRITSDGNIGIGTTSPDSLLHLKKSSGAKVTIESDDNNDAWINFSGASNEMSVGFDKTINSLIVSNSDSIQANQRGVITSAGNVGIGTTSPSQKLEVNGLIKITGSGGQGVNIENSGGTNAACINLKNTLTNYVKEYRVAVAGSDGAYATASSLFIRDQTANATRLELNTSGDVKVSSGDITFGTAGKGIVLGATSNLDSNTLDDYEEGSFTMFFWTSNTSFSTAPTLIHNNCRYTKIGTQVTFSAYISWGNQAAGGAGALYLGGLPFTHNSNASYGAISFGWYATGAGFNANEHLVGYYNNGSTNIILLRQAIGSSGGRSYATLPHSAIVGSSGTFGISGTYIANS